MSSDSASLERKILGIRFFIGTVRQAVDRMLQGGLLVVPAAPALKDLPTRPAYREALLNADMVITDSAFMVLIWNFLQKDHIQRVSGLKYLRLLLQEPSVRQAGDTFWVMAGSESAARNVAWLKQDGIDVPAEYVYNAPMYGEVIDDPALLGQLERLKPKHIVVTIGGGNQERLGYYLQQKLSYRPGIHCIGAAIAFLSGDQVSIPVWADQLYLGWLLRVLDKPKLYLPRYIAATSLFQLMRRYRDTLPPLQREV